MVPHQLFRIPGGFRAELLFMRNRAVLVIGLVAVMSVSACIAGGGDRPAAPATNWNAPLADGITVPSVAAAQALVRFRVIAPAFGAPALIQVDDPALGMPESERTVAFVFHLAGYGIVVVEESEQGGWTLARFRDRANTPVAQGPSPSGPNVYPFQMVPVRQTEGLLARSGGEGSITSIMWIEKSTLFRILGPSITPEQVQALAAQL